MTNNTACLFCELGKDFNTKEHIVPESLGNDDLILEKEVCDCCQNYLSQIESYVLNKTPIGFWRTLLAIKNKKGRLPAIDFFKDAKGKGAIPDSHPYHDNVAFKANSTFTAEINFLDSNSNFLNDEIGKVNYVITPKVIHEIGRFLGKIGMELICYNDRNEARAEEFNSIRKYVRHGSLKDLWPIFHVKKGVMQDLVVYRKVDESVEEVVLCYSFELLQIGDYVVLSFVVGLDNWFICLNQQFPHPEISKYMGEGVNAIWYPKEQWKNS